MARGGYRKFSGRSAFSVQKAYLGEDHLLIVQGVYKESTKRIRYEDIEAILICPTKTGAVMSMLAGLGTVLFTVVALANLQNSSFVLWLIVAVVTGAIFGLGLYHRGSAVFGVQTAVQTVVLAGLGSRRKSAKATAQLAERAEAVQGRLSVEALRAAHQARRSAAWAARGRPKPTAGAARPPPIQKNRTAPADGPNGGQP
jgi:hypothetical protein